MARVASNRPGLKSSRTTASELERVFERHADVRTHTLDVHSFVLCMKDLPAEIPPSAWENVFHAVDVDGSNTLDFDEFCYMYYNRRKLGHETEEDYKQTVSAIRQERLETARQKIDDAEQRRLEIFHRKFIEDTKLRNQARIDTMYSRVKNKATLHKVCKDFDIDDGGDLLDRISVDFGFPLPDLLPLKCLDEVLVYKKGLGLQTQSWCSGEFHGHRGIFPMAILDNAVVYEQMHARSKEYEDSKVKKRRERAQWKKREEEKELEKCTFAPQMVAQNKNPNLNLPAVVEESFTTDDLEVFRREAAESAFGDTVVPFPLIVVKGQRVTVLKRGLGKNGTWNFGGDGTHQGFFPDHCLHVHAHFHAMYDNHEKKETRLREALLEKELEFERIYTFAPKLNEKRLQRILPDDYKRLRAIRESKRQVKILKEMTQELTFYPKLYLPAASSLVRQNWDARGVLDGANNNMYNSLFGEEGGGKRVEVAAEYGEGQGTAGSRQLSKELVLKEFKFSRPGATAQILIPAFGLKYPPPLELHKGERVKVLQTFIGKDASWAMGKLGKVTGVFPMECIGHPKKNTKAAHQKRPSKNGVQKKVHFSGSPIRPPANEGKGHQVSPKTRFTSMRTGRAEVRESKNFVSPVNTKSTRHNVRVNEYVNNTMNKIILKPEEDVQLRDLRVRVKQNISKSKVLNKRKTGFGKTATPNVVIDPGAEMHRSEFTAWLIRNELINSEPRRVVDYFFDSVAGDREAFTFRDLRKSLNAVKVTMQKKKQSW